MADERISRFGGFATATVAAILFALIIGPIRHVDPECSAASSPPRIRVAPDFLDVNYR